jgi:hypothetical protein
MTLGKRLEGIEDSTKHKLIRKAVYLVSHLCFGTASMFLAALMYNNQAAHFAFALCILSASAWNGAGFYGEIFQPQQQPKSLPLLCEKVRSFADSESSNLMLSASVAGKVWATRYRSQVKEAAEGLVRSQEADRSHRTSNEETREADSK